MTTGKRKERKACARKSATGAAGGRKEDKHHHEQKERWIGVRRRRSSRDEERTDRRREKSVQGLEDRKEERSKKGEGVACCPYVGSWCVATELKVRSLVEIGELVFAEWGSSRRGGDLSGGMGGGQRMGNDGMGTEKEGRLWSRD
ncbi:hypothetical protein R1flu_003584 [Riccia fluitans]|uniref:Uncharacterized protein n=1 Tax=Riccia fluitans TaxID=41844 RepID=A0ABD1YAD8_9MARC